MSEYQVLARKYRPQTFREVLGQDAIVATLKNAIKLKRLAHAYLFCGSRGTGKTSIARVFAKAVNCENLSADFEPCGSCPSCKEIAMGNSLDVLEIDGASHRGIDDIRQINETVGYSTSSGRYKIYIIDEVHMLTKEAFNALLKTLEEPPPKVMFFFATTEPHKVLPTIISRCQRFHLNRFPTEVIVQKLSRIVGELGSSVDEDALAMIAQRAEGGLRDAESLLDQILAYQGQERVTAEAVAAVLGIVPQEVFFELDRAGKEGRLEAAFTIVERIFSEGKDLSHFLEMLTEHFRNILVTKLCGDTTDLLSLGASLQEKYVLAAALYRKDQCLELLDYLIDKQQKIKTAPSQRLALESALLYVMRSHCRVPVSVLVERLSELENSVKAAAPEGPSPTGEASPAASAPPVQQPVRAPQESSSAPPLVRKAMIPSGQQARYDTLLQFAAVELEGKLQKNN